VSPDWTLRPIFGGVLIGGASRRMGTPKSLLRFDGRTFAEHVISALQRCVHEVVLLGDGPLPASARRLAQLPDVPGHSGPLGGMLAAMQWQRDACWIFAACDLPRLRTAALDWLIAQRAPERWAVLPQRAAGRVQPLLALYEPEALELLAGLARRGIRAPSALAGAPLVHSPTPPPALRVCWTNVNTPEEYERTRDAADQPSL